MSVGSSKEVGKISIRVVPDLDNFRSKLKKELEAIENGLKVKVKVVADGVAKVKAEVASAAKDQTAKVHVDADTKGVRQKIEAAARGAKAEVDVDVGLDRFQRRLLGRLQKAFSSIEPKLELDVDGEALRRSFDKTERKIRDSLNLKIPVELEEAAEFRSEVDRLVRKADELNNSIQKPLEFNLFDDKAQWRALQRIDAGMASIRQAEAKDWANREQALRRWVQQTQDAAKAATKAVVVEDVKNHSVRIGREHELQELKLKLDTSVAALELQTFKARHANEHIDVAVKVGGIEAATAALRKLFGDKDKAVKGGGVSGADLLPSFGSGINPAGYAVIAAGVLAAFAPIVSVVSGLLSTLPGVIAAIAAPITAAMVGLEGIKAAASQLQGPFDALKASVASVFEQSLTPIFAKLQSVFPTLTAGLQQVAAGMSTAFGGVVDSLTSNTGMTALSQMFQNIGQSIAAMAPGLQSLTTGLIQMAAGVTSVFPQVAQWFNTVSESFGKWVTQMTTVGPNGITPLQTALTSLGAILQPIIGMLGDLFTKGMAALQDPNFVAAIVGFAGAMRVLVSAIMDASTAFMSFIGSINLGSISFVADAVAGLANAFASVSSFAGRMAAGVATGIAQVVAAVSSGLAQIPGIVANVFQSAVSVIVGAIAGWVSAVVSGGAQVIAEVASWPGKVAGALAGLGAAGAEAGQALVQGLVNAISGGVGAVITAAGNLARQALAAAKSALGINSPSKKFMEVGDFAVQGLVDGLDPTAAVAQAKSLGEQITQAVRDGIDPSKFQEDIKQSLDALELQRKQLKVEYDGVPKADRAQRSAIKDRMDEISTMKDTLGLQKDQIAYQSKYGEQVGESKDVWDGMNQKIVEGISNVGQGVVQSYAQDLGISGNGMIPSLMKWGMQAGSSFVFNVANADDAMRIKDNQLNKEALPYMK